MPVVVAEALLEGRRLSVDEAAGWLVSCRQLRSSPEFFPVRRAAGVGVASPGERRAAAVRRRAWVVVNEVPPPGWLQ